MSAYLVTREGQELGSFEAVQIQEGLQNGNFLPSDWGWREGMDGWKGLAEIFGTATASRSRTSSPPPENAPVKKPVQLKPEINPYASPASNIVIERSSGDVSQDVVNELKGTRPWVLFISVVMWIIGGGFALILLFSVFFGRPGLGNSFSSGSLLSNVFGLLFTLVFCYIIIFPALRLSRYASNISRLAQSGSSADLAAALSEQRRFWRFHGIVMLAYLGFMLLVAVWSVLAR